MKPAPGKSENDRPVAPTRAATEQCVAGEQRAECRRVEQVEPGEWPGWRSRAARCRRRQAPGRPPARRMPCRRRSSAHGVGRTPAAPVRRVLAQPRGDGDMVVVAVCADHRDDVATGDGVLDGLRVVRGVDDDHLQFVADDQMLLSTSQLPPSSSKVRGDDPLGCRSSQDHHRAQHLTGVHLVEPARSAPSVRCRARRRTGQRQPSWRYRRSRVGKSRSGQAVAVPGRLQRTAAGRVHQRHLQTHVRSRNTHQHSRSGQVAGVESLLPGLRPARR